MLCWIVVKFVVKVKLVVFVKKFVVVKVFVMCKFKVVKNVFEKILNFMLKFVKFVFVVFGVKVEFRKNGGLLDKVKKKLNLMVLVIVYVNFVGKMLIWMLFFEKGILVVMIVLIEKGL